MTCRARFAAWTSIGLTLLAGAGCMQEPPDRIQIGIVASPSAEVLYLAQERGLFDAEGVAVRLVEHTTANDVERAFERSQLDGMAVTLVEVMHSREEVSRRPQVVLVTDAAGSDCGVIAAPEIRTVADLRGRRVAAEPKTVSMYVLLDALHRAGLESGDVSIVPADPMEMASLLADGTVAAVAVYPPWSQMVLRSGQAHVLPDATAIHALDVLSLHSEVVAAREADVRAILRAWDRAVAMVRAAPDQVEAAMAARERLTVAEFGPLLRRARFLTAEASGTPGRRRRMLEALGSIWRVLHDHGELTGPRRADELVASDMG